MLSDFQKINTFVLDVDGVLTDGSVLITEEGPLLRNMYIKDGFALQLAIKAGYRIIIITGGKSEGVVKRLQGLGIHEIYSGSSDKKAVWDKLVEENKIDPHTCLYMGDDIPDLIVMGEAGLSCCPADAATDVLEMCQYIAEKDGGRGCVREVIEKTMRIQSKWKPLEQVNW